MTAVPQPRCPYCDLTTHSSLRCPRVKAFEYDANGFTIRRVEFHDPASSNAALLERAETLVESIKQGLDQIARLRQRIEVPDTESR